jgi:hypothetical protein
MFGAYKFSGANCLAKGLMTGARELVFSQIEQAVGILRDVVVRMRHNRSD